MRPTLNSRSYVGRGGNASSPPGHHAAHRMITGDHIGDMASATHTTITPKGSIASKGFSA